MSISCNALYSDLLLDLSDYLPSYTIASLFNGDAVEAWPDMTYRQFAALALAKSSFKKFEDDACASADRVALDNFLACNNRCGDWSFSPQSYMDELLLGNFYVQTDRFFHPHHTRPLILSGADIFHAARTGPGASIAATGNDFYSKLFAGPLSASSEGLSLMYQTYIKYLPYWVDAEEHRSSRFGGVNVVGGNRLSFVPKNVDTSRVTCTEPLLNMFFQLGVGDILAKRLIRAFGIDISCQQDVNRELARVGSLSGDLATLDLSSASDTVGLAMCERFIPKSFMAWVRLFRSKQTQLPNGQQVELKMVSSMGNGFTFALETALFSCVVAAVYEILELELIRPKYEAGRLRNIGNFGVFGDDIIVTKEAVPYVVRLLTLLGFEVNTAKSFTEGPFRESCGGDFFKGRPARGVYIKSLRKQESRFVAINRLNQWTSVTRIPVPRTVQRLLRSVRWLPVPLHESDDAGIIVPLAYAKGIKFDANQTATYTRWLAKPKYLRIGDGVITAPRKRGKKAGRVYNPSGLLMSCLHGDVRGSKISIRSGATSYGTNRALSPCWDYCPPVRGETRIGLTRLIDAVTMNMMF